MSLLLFWAAEGSGMGSVVGTDSATGNVDVLTGVNWPTGVQSGDVALLPWVMQDTVTAVDPTSETWTLVGVRNHASSSVRLRVLKRICDGTESGAISGWSNSGTVNRQTAGLIVYRGYSDVAGIVFRDETTAGTSHDCSSIGTGDGAANGDHIVAVSSDRAATLTGAVTPPTSPDTFTERIDLGAGGSGGTYLNVADDGLATSQTMPYDPNSFTGHVSSINAITATIALRPTATGTDLVVDNSTQAQSAGNVTLTQDHNLTVAAATQGQTATNLSLTQVHNLVVQGATQAQTAGTVALTQTHNLTVANAAQAQAADNVTLNTATNLTVQNAIQAQTAQQATLTQTHNLAVQGATQAQVSGNVTLTQAHNLTVQGAAQAQAAGSVSLTQTHVLVVAGAVQAQTATSIILSLDPPRDITVIAKLRSDHVAGSVALTDLVAGLRSSHITGGVDVPRNMLTGSVEYVTAEVTFVGETAATIATVTGQVKITSDDTIPSSWDNADVTERTDVNGGALLALKKLHTAGAAGEYRVWAKVSDSPEVPILKCGSFTVR